MAVHKINRGLTLPILGEPLQEIEESRALGSVAILADDYVGMRPTLHVTSGDEVRRGELLFEDKKTPGVRYTAPGAGTVVAINRGERRMFRSLVIKLNRSEREGRHSEGVSFGSFSGRHPSGLTGDEVRELLAESGLWTALRGRPFNRVADPLTRPHSIFVTAIDTNPLAPSVDVILEGAHAAFERGLFAITKLTDGNIFVCTAQGCSLRMPQIDQVSLEVFKGPHPAGNVGTHIHRLDPVDRNKVVWHLGYQDVIAIGKLFETGTLYVERIISLAGPSVKRPRLLKIRLGASTDEIVTNELGEGDNRVISGSVFSGNTALGNVTGFLGRYDQQISILREGIEREFLGWLSPGLNKFSVLRTFVSRLIPNKRFAFTTSTHGSKRAIVPIGMYEQVMPMDIMPTFLLRALFMEDVERAEELGCLELAEEDLGLCTFVCPGKVDYGRYLRAVLTNIEREG